MPEAKKDIENFVSHLRSIQDAYHNIVSINAQTEERVRQEFQRRLDNNDKQIADMLETKEQQKVRIDELQDSYKKAEGDLMLKEYNSRDISLSSCTLPEVPIKAEASDQADPLTRECSYYEEYLKEVRDA